MRTRRVGPLCGDIVAQELCYLEPSVGRAILDGGMSDDGRRLWNVILERAPTSGEAKALCAHLGLHPNSLAKRLRVTGLPSVFDLLAAVRSCYGIALLAAGVTAEAASVALGVSSSQAWSRTAAHRYGETMVAMARHVTPAQRRDWLVETYLRAYGPRWAAFTFPRRWADWSGR